MKECFNTSTVFRQRKQHNWKLMLHADTAAILSQMNKTLKFKIQWFFLYNMTSYIKFSQDAFTGNACVQ